MQSYHAMCRAEIGVRYNVNISRISATGRAMLKCTRGERASVRMGVHTCVTRPGVNCEEGQVPCYRAMCWAESGVQNSVNTSRISAVLCRAEVHG